MSKLILENPGMHQEAKPELFRFARNNRETPTQAEAMLWEVLRDKKLQGHKFRRQHPIGKFILDFYCHASKLAIEVDGGYHLTQEQVEYDLNRTTELERIQIRVIRFTNDQVLNYLSVVVEDILFCLNAPPPALEREPTLPGTYSVAFQPIMHSAGSAPL